MSFSWKRNLIFLCVAQLLTLIGFSTYLPLIPYYVQEMGASTYAEAMAVMAYFDGGGALSMALAAPLWGALADRHGRKLMLVRATLAGSVLAFLMGLATSPSQLIVIRILQGFFCGTVAAANTLVATETPEEHLGKSLGVMQTVQFVGHATGPLVGGLLADAFGYRAIFPISSTMIAIALVALLLFVREKRFVPAPKKQAREAVPHLTFRQRMAGMATRNTAVLMLALASNSFGIAVLSPVMSLYIQSLNTNPERLATLAGMVVSISALTSSVSALALGSLADKVGQRMVLLACVIGVTLIFVPQAMVTNVTQLIILRALQGVCMGGIMPTANALLARSVPPSRRGITFGMASSAQAGGRALGPMLGASVASTWGMHSAFLVTAGIFSAISVLVATMVHPESRPAEYPQPGAATEDPTGRFPGGGTSAHIGRGPLSS